MKIACLQITSINDIAANIAMIEPLVQQAAAGGAELIALPENAFFMDAPGQSHIIYAQHEHPGVQAASAMARRHQCWLLLGSVAVKAEGEKNFNRSLLFDQQGGIAAHYDKVHLFDVTLAGGESYLESARMVGGAKAVVADMAGVKLGMTICYDVRFPHLYRALAKAGATIMAVPAAFTAFTGEAHWHVLLRARAIENGCFVIAPAQTGTHPGNRKTYGHALIIDPWGKVLADAGAEPSIITADLDLGQVARVRATIPSLSHDREFTC